MGNSETEEIDLPLELIDIIMKDAALRSSVHRNIAFRKRAKREVYEFYDRNGRVVGVKFDSNGAIVSGWRLSASKDGEQLMVKQGSFKNVKDWKSFERALGAALMNLSSAPAPKVIDPKGRWTLKVFGVILSLFVFASVKVFSVLEPDMSFVWFRGELAYEAREWQVVVSALGPSGLGDVFLGSIVANPAASLSCLGIVSFAIYSWTTPVRQSTSDLLTPWAVVTAFVIPAVCVILAIWFLSWWQAMIIVGGYVIFTSVLFMPTSWAPNISRWSAAAREFVLIKNPSVRDDWIIDFGGWKRVTLSTSKIAQLVILHANRWERLADSYGERAESKLRFSLTIIEYGGELLAKLKKYPDESNGQIMSRVSSGIARRSKVASLRVALVGKGLLILGLLSATWLATDSTPWMPKVCVDGEPSYLVSGTPAVRIEDSTRNLSLVGNDSVVREVVRDKCPVHSKSDSRADGK